MSASASERAPAGSVAREAPEAVPRRPSGRGWLRPVVFGLAVYLLWSTGLYFYQDKLLFPAGYAPAPLRRPLPRPVCDQVVVYRIDVPGGHNEAWLCPAPGIGAERPGPAVVFCHGNAEIIDYQDHLVRRYQEMGVSVLLPEFRGYGAAAGKPSQQAILEDNVRFYDWLVQRPEVDARRIVFHGRSLGGGAACDLATQREPEALVLESVFTSAASMARRYLVPAFLCQHPFRNDEVLRATGFPVLVGHGTRDRIIPVSHARALRDLPGRGVSYVEYDCDHNGFPGPAGEEDWWARIRTFLREAGVLAAPASASAAAGGAAGAQTGDGRHARIEGLPESRGFRDNPLLDAGHRDVR